MGRMRKDQLENRKSSLDNSQSGVLYFSRGNGRAHAITDMAILKVLAVLCRDLEFLVVSYATGADTFRQNGHPVVDLDLQEHPTIFEILISAGKIIEKVKPRAIVSHEGFMVLPAAKILDIPTVLITHWFSHPHHSFMLALEYADKVVFIEEPGLFKEPPSVRGKVDYVGPAVRDFSYTRVDRSRARRELELSDNSLIILLMQGSSPESWVPILDSVVSAFTLLKIKDKHLIWLAGDDYAAIQNRLKERPDITVKDVDWQIDRLMVASDLVITKATYNTTIELTALGIPSIAILGKNPLQSRLDEVFLKRNPKTAILKAGDLSSRRLGVCMRRSLSLSRWRWQEAFEGSKVGPASAADWPSSNGIEGAAKAIASFLGEVRV